MVRDQLKRLLDYLEGRIDLEHCAAVAQKYRRALSYGPLDRPPLVISCVESVAGFEPFGYAESYDEPAKMMFNQLLSRVAMGVELGDDSPLAIRSDHGIIQVGALLGGKWCITGDNYPWMGHCDNREQLFRFRCRIYKGQSTRPICCGGMAFSTLFTTNRISCRPCWIV